MVGLADAIAIAAEGQYHTCALRATGEVACWGANNVLQLGHGSGPSRQRPQDIAGLDRVIAIAAGGEESCALRDDRSVICWSRYTQKGQRGFDFSAVPLRVAFQP